MLAGAQDLLISSLSSKAQQSKFITYLCSPNDNQEEIIYYFPRE